MALSGPTLLTADPDTANASSYVTPSVSPTGDALIVVDIVNTDATDAIIPASVTAGFSTGSWTIEASSSIQAAAATRRVTRAWAIAAGTPGSGTVTVGFGGDSQTGCIVTVSQYTGQHLTTPILNHTTNEGGGAGATSLSITLTNALQAATSICHACIMHSTNEAQTEGSGAAELASSDVGYNTPTTRSGVYTELNDRTVSASWTTSSAKLASASEIVEAEPVSEFPPGIIVVARR